MLMMHELFVPCGEKPEVEVTKENDKYIFKCPKFQMFGYVDISDLIKCERRENRNLLRGYSINKIKLVALCRGIRDFCYERCPYKPKYAITDPKHNYAHHLAAYLVAKFSFDLAEEILRLPSKGNDTVRRMLGNIYKLEDLFDERVKKYVTEIIEGVDEQGRSKLKDAYENQVKRSAMWSFIVEGRKGIFSKKLLMKKSTKTIIKLKNKGGKIYIYNPSKDQYYLMKYLYIPAADFIDFFKQFVDEGEEKELVVNIEVEVRGDSP